MRTIDKEHSMFNLLRESHIADLDQYRRFLNRERELVIELQRKLAVAEAELETLRNPKPRLLVACSWCDPNAFAERYYLCDKHQIELKALQKGLK